MRIEEVTIGNTPIVERVDPYEIIEARRGSFGTPTLPPGVSMPAPRKPSSSSRFSFRRRVAPAPVVRVRSVSLGADLRRNTVLEGLRGLSGTPSSYMAIDRPVNDARQPATDHFPYHVWDSAANTWRTRTGHVLDVHPYATGERRVVYVLGLNYGYYRLATSADPPSLAAPAKPSGLSAFAYYTKLFNEDPWPRWFVPGNPIRTPLLSGAGAPLNAYDKALVDAATAAALERPVLADVVQGKMPFQTAVAFSSITGSSSSSEGRHYVGVGWGKYNDNGKLRIETMQLDYYKTLDPLFWVRGAGPIKVLYATAKAGVKAVTDALCPFVKNPITGAMISYAEAAVMPGMTIVANAQGICSLVSSDSVTPPPPATEEKPNYTPLIVGGAAILLLLALK